MIYSPENTCERKLSIQEREGFIQKLNKYCPTKKIICNKCKKTYISRVSNLITECIFCGCKEVE